jgi:hypothetical protein
MTRDEQVRAETQNLKIMARICGLKRLALESVAVFERLDATLNRELRAMIDDDDRNSTGV